MKRACITSLILSLIIVTACRAAPPPTPTPTIAPATATAVPPTIASSPTPAPPSAVETTWLSAGGHVRGHIPTNTAVADRQPLLKLIFNAEMDKESIANALSVQPPLPYDLSWQGKTLLIQVTQPLDFATEYTFTLDESAMTQSRVHLSEPYTWDVRLKEVVKGVSAASASRPDAPIIIRFNYPMDKTAVSQNLQIKPDIQGKMSWNTTRTVLTIIPERPLTPDAEYAIQFTGPLQTDDGAAIPPPAPLTFTTPPPILSRSPQQDGVSPTTVIRIRFDRPMDKAATEAAFSLEPPVDGSFTWDETTLTFQPADGYFAANTTYIVTIGPEARGAAGEAILTAPDSWQFSTGQLTTLADFGYGPNAQIVDANGRRAIQFQTANNLPTAVTFELYPLTLEQFLTQYSSNFKRLSPWDNEAKPNLLPDGQSPAYTWEMKTEPAITEWANVHELTLPADASPDLYVLNMRAGETDAQLLLALTAHTLVVKQAPGQITAWVTDINGEPTPDTAVTVYARSGEPLAQGQAGADGIFRAQIPPFNEGGPPATEPLIIVARRGDDITVSGLGPEWSSSGSYGWRNWRRPAPSNAPSAAFIHTDRPIYKPGQTVYYKAILRLDDDAQLSVPPAGTAVTVRIRDGRGNVVRTEELFTNDFGSVNGTFQIAEGAPLGDWRVAVSLNEAEHEQIFKVEDYRKPDYEVTVMAAQTALLTGEPIEITIEARYFFGEPVANAAVTVQSLPGWWQPYNNKSVSGQTDENGRFTLTLPGWNNNALDGYYNYYNSWQSNHRRISLGIEATVDDGSHQTVSGYTAVTLHNTAEILTADSRGYVHKPGQPFTVNATVRDIFDQPVANRQLELTVRRWNANDWEYTTVIQSIKGRTGADGRTAFNLTIEEPGYYQLHLTGKDANGRNLRYVTYVYAFSDFYANWYGRDSSSLSISADRDEYAPGDTARLIVESSVSGPALLTIERGQVRDERLVQLTAPVTVIELPIEPDYTPNVYAAIHVWQEQSTLITEQTNTSLPESRLQSAYVNLSVPAADKRLQLSITPGKEVYTPGEEATFTVHVRNAKGEPVSAELSLALVDEAIFALSEELSGPMYDAFYYQRGNQVRSYNSLALVRWMWEGGMGGGGDGGPTATAPRRDFQDTAAWFPVLVTDYKGEAAITVTLPDNLTTWRLTAKAATADTQVGETTATIRTHQPVIVRPILPRALTTGDTAVLSAIVHNYSDETQELVVGMKIEDSKLEVEGAAAHTITLQPGEQQIVGWGVTAVAAGTTELTIAASGNGPGDAVRLPLIINPLAVPDVQTQVGQFNNQLRTTVAISADALPLSYVEIQLSRSIAGTLLEGLDYLTGFPYGCVEQTMSKALPNAVVGRALNQLGVSDPTLEAELPGYINASIQRLYGFQHLDGGWGWWFDDPSHDYQTAWVIFGLAQTADAGYEIDPQVIERGVNWLNEHLAQMDPRTRAFALYALATAGQPNAEATLSLAQDRASLQENVFSLAGLALALDELGEKALAQKIMDGLADTAVTRNGFVHWEGSRKDGYYRQKTMASDVRSTALALSAFSQIRPGHPLEGGIVRWLMSQRRTQGWGTTNETSFAILGLTDHLLATAFNDASANSRYTVQLNGETITEGTLGKGAPAVTLRIPRADLLSGENEIVLTQNGKRPLYYTINSRIYLPQREIEAAGVIQIERAYLDPETNKPRETITAGELVKVRLTVTLPERGSYVIVEDKLPGGLEALNEGLNTTQRLDATPRWREYGYNYKEIRGDQVSFFITEMRPGKHTFTYFARATHDGRFTAMPTEAYAMYDPAFWGRSASEQVSIEE